MNCDNCKFIFWCRFKRDMQKMGAKITSCPDYKPKETLEMPHVPRYPTIQGIIKPREGEK